MAAERENPRDPKQLGGLILLLGAVLVALVVAGNLAGGDAQGASPVSSAPSTAPSPATSAVTSTQTTPPPPVSASTTPPTTAAPPYDGWVDPAAAGRPWSELGAVDGLLTFRGNPSRTFYGRGPVPTDPTVQWTFDIGCSISFVGAESKNWCGSGWTGQPSVFHPPGDDTAWWVAFGGYNRKVNFLDPATGAEVYPAYATDDIIKGSITIDPDGFPLMYTGSRDDNFHVVAIDGAEPRALWKLNAAAVQPTKWNNDWDGSALIIDDYLFEGGENSRFFIVKLNRDFDGDGKVTVDPEIVFSTEGWDDELTEAVGGNVSIENSVAISGNTVYFANSGGLVQGWDLTSLEAGGTPERVLRFWTGDDTDATIVIDDEGMLYVGSEYELGNGRSQELGQIIKLDPTKPDNPVVWSRDARSGIPSGVWATPALYSDLVIVSTDDGRVLGLDRADGGERWVLNLPGPLWQSPVVVDGVLIQGDCEGVLHAYDISDTSTEPVSLWDVEIGGCIESTPAVWNGQIFVGSRNGFFYAIG